MQYDQDFGPQYEHTNRTEVVPDKYTNKKIFDYRRIWYYNKANKRHYLFTPRHEKLIKNSAVTLIPGEFLFERIVSGVNAAETIVEFRDGNEITNC